MQAELKHWEGNAPMRAQSGEPVTYNVPARETLTPPHNPYTSGYGAKIPTRYQVRFGSRWRRVYAACYGNAATLYIGKPGAWLATVETIDGRPA